MTLYLVGMRRKDLPDWEFVGIYTTQDLAIKACLDSQYFYAPVVPNVTMPEERQPWPELHWPHLEWSP